MHLAKPKSQTLSNARSQHTQAICSLLCPCLWTRGAISPTHVTTSFAALSLIGHRMGTAPEIKLLFNTRFNLPHYTVRRLKDKGRGNKILTIYLNWAYTGSQANACMWSRKPAAWYHLNLQVLPPKSFLLSPPTRIPAQHMDLRIIHSSGTNLFFFFSSFFGGYAKGIQMLHFICLLELHAYH